jgi:hypothetical protein
LDADPDLAFNFNADPVFCFTLMPILIIEMSWRQSNPDPHHRIRIRIRITVSGFGSASPYPDSGSASPYQDSGSA